MKLLLTAAIRSSKHFFLACVTMIALFFLSVANTAEMFTLGVMANTGTDFFVLFSKQDKEKISLEEVKENWPKIDKENKGYISKKEANRYNAENKKGAPLNRLLSQISSYFDFDANFGKFIFFLIGVALVKAFFLFASRFSAQLLSIRVTRDLRLQYFEHIQSLPLSFFHEHNLGSLASRSVGDAGQIAASLNSSLTNYLQTPFIILSNFVACFCLSWKLSSVIFFGLPLIVLPIIFLTKRVKKVSRQMQKNQESFTSVLLDFLSGIHTVKIFSMEELSLQKFKKQNDRMAELESKSAKYSLLTRPVLHLVSTACLSFVVIIGLYSLHMGVAELIMFCGLLHLFYEPVKKFAEENANIQRGVVAAERMFEVLHLKPQIQDRDGAFTMTSFQDLLEFDHVSFRYKDEWVLKDLSFTIKKGQTIAIVGPTGCGKSTIVHLIPRLYDVQKGEIRIDGVPITEYTQKSLRENLSFVPQKPFLFYDTILENITFGRPYTRQEVYAASRRAHAHEFIERLPLTYDCVIAEEGKTLSGGQQQRLAIARALVKNAPILILDEATSALDAVSESRIRAALKELRGEVTQILIAHRLSTIEDVDKILYLERGRKIAEGTKEELLASCRGFRNMWEHFHQSDKSFSEEKQEKA
jgi:ABC-type multidrug transport system fused ATPase/permease subunit